MTAARYAFAPAFNLLPASKRTSAYVASELVVSKSTVAGWRTNGLSALEAELVAVDLLGVEPAKIWPGWEPPDDYVPRAAPIRLPPPERPSEPKPPGASKTAPLEVKLHRKDPPPDPRPLLDELADACRSLPPGEWYSALTHHTDRKAKTLATKLLNELGNGFEVKAVGLEVFVRRGDS